MERLLSHISCYRLYCGSSRTSESFLVVVGFHGTPGIFPSVFHGRWDRNKFHGQFPQNLEHWRNASTFSFPRRCWKLVFFPHLFHPECSRGTMASECHELSYRLWPAWFHAHLGSRCLVCFLGFSQEELVSIVVELYLCGMKEGLGFLILSFCWCSRQLFCFN